MATLRELVTKLSFSANLDPLLKVSKAVDGIKGRLNLLVGAEAIKGLASLTDRFGDFALDLRNSAEAAGITTAEFQKLSFAASQNGIRQEELGKVLGTLNKKLQAARLGSEEANLAFARAGLTPDQIGSFHNAEDALFAVGRSLQSIPDPILRASAAWDTLGEGNVRLLASMNAGANGLGKMARSSDAAASVLDDGMLDSLIKSEQASIALRQSVHTLAAQMMTTFAPIVTKVVQGLTSFVRTLHDLTATTFTKFVYNVGFAMGFTQGVIEDVSLAVIQTIRLFAKWGEDSGLFSAIKKGFEWIGSAAVASFNGILAIANRVMDVLARISVWYETLDLRTIRGWASAMADVALALTKWVNQGLIDGVVGVLNGVKGVYQVISSIWAMLTGKRIEDTWLGRISGLFGGMSQGAEAQAGPGMAYNPAPMQSLAQMTAGPSVMGPQASLGASGQDPSARINYTVEAPVTINVAGTADPAKLYESVRDGIADHHDKVLRQAQSAGAVAVVY